MAVPIPYDSDRKATVCDASQTIAPPEEREAFKGHVMVELCVLS